MKKIPYSIMLLFIISFGYKVAKSQSSSATNPVAALNTPFAAGIDFLGWSALAPAIPLNIKTELAQPISLYTFAGPAGLANMRMQIYDVTGGAFNSGFIGIGNCNAFLPQSLLHQNSIDTMNYHQFTLAATGGGASSSEGFQVGVRTPTTPFWDWQGPIPPYTAAELKLWEDAPIDFYSNDISSPTYLPLRMRITYGDGSDKTGTGLTNVPGVTKVLISHAGTTGAATLPDQFFPLTDAVAMLNLGENHIAGPGSTYDAYIGGARHWMDVGTYYNFDSDNMYTGLKDNGENKKDAVICWGDDPSHDSQPPNKLMFIFAATGGTSHSVGQEGLEVVRMFAPSGDFGMVGIGGDPTITVPNTNYYFPQSGSTVDPGNTLEVNSPDLDATITPGGNSGLRFSDLNTTSGTIANTGLGLLSVDLEGDVVYVDAIGNYCNTLPQRPLKANYEIPLDRFDYFFSGQGLGVTDVIVGTSCANNNPFAKFQVYQSTDQMPTHGRSVAGLFENNTTDKNAIGVEAKSLLSLGNNFGVVGLVTQYQGAYNVGVLGSANNYPNLLGGLAGLINVGTYGFVQHPPPNSGPYVNYAVVGDLGIVGCPACPPTGNAFGFGDYAGYFNGDFITTSLSYLVSDSTLKENIQDIINPMDVINALNPKSYTFKQLGNESMILPFGTHYGVLAQNMQTVLPGAVKNSIHPPRYDSLGIQTHAEINFKGVNSIEVIPFLIAAVKEQQQTIEAMQAEFALINGGGNRQGNPNDKGTLNSIEIELKNSRTIILDQNHPNPFHDRTTISYEVPADIISAQILFYDSKGTVLRTVEIPEKGKGEINVYAPDLAGGIYKYTLIGDGKVIETKAMVKQ